jgi:hypothetical protein
MHRRELLKYMGLLALAPGCDFSSILRRPASEIKEEILFTGFRKGDPYDHEDSGLMLVGPHRTQKINLKTEIHSVLYSQKKDLKVFISKLEETSFYQFGDGDIQKFFPAEGNFFYGHGVIDEEAGILYTTQAKAYEDRGMETMADVPGYLYAYDLSDFKLRGKFTSHGADPHDLRILGDELIVCNGGLNSNVAFMDRKTMKLRQVHRCPYTHIGMRHLDVIDDDNFAVAPLAYDKNQSCGFFLLNRYRGFVEWKGPVNFSMTLLRHQVLSVLVHGRHILGTCPATGTLLIWTTSGTLVGAHSIKNVASLAYSPSLGGVLVGAGDDTVPLHLVKISGDTITLKELDWGFGSAGSHSFIL